MPTATCILVIEDDAAIRRGIADALRFAGHDVIEAGDGPGGLRLALESAIDLVLLDVSLPGRSGFDILGPIRSARPTLPIIMVTARGSEDDRVRGLDGGADDYVTKPFSARELLARVDAVLRRSPQRPSDVALLRAGDLCIDLARGEVRTPGGAPRPLSPREAEILRYLAAHRERAVDRAELLQNVWGLHPRGMRTRTVDMHIARLREKLAGAEVIRTVHGRGYALAESVDAAAAGEPA